MTKLREERAQYRKESVPALAAAIRREEERLGGYRFDQAVRKLSNTSAIRRSRRSIARMKTILRETIAAAAGGAKETK